MKCMSSYIVQIKPQIYRDTIPIQTLLKYTRAELDSENIIKGLKGLMPYDINCQKIKMTKKKNLSSIILLMVIHDTIQTIFSGTY